MTEEQEVEATIHTPHDEQSFEEEAGDGDNFNGVRWYAGEK